MAATGGGTAKFTSVITGLLGGGLVGEGVETEGVETGNAPGSAAGGLIGPVDEGVGKEDCVGVDGVKGLTAVRPDVGAEGVVGGLIGVKKVISVSGLRCVIIGGGMFGLRPVNVLGAGNPGLVGVKNSVASEPTGV